jgi:hypothetical protein
MRTPGEGKQAGCDAGRSMWPIAVRSNGRTTTRARPIDDPGRPLFPAIDGCPPPTLSPSSCSSPSMRSSILQCTSRLPSASSSLRVASAVRSVGTQPSSSSTPAPSPTAAPRTDASGKTTHFGFKTVREEDKEDLGE